MGNSSENTKVAKKQDLKRITEEFLRVNFDISPEKRIAIREAGYRAKSTDDFWPEVDRIMKRG